MTARADLAAFSATLLLSCPSFATPPLPELDGAEPAVVRKITATRELVLANPDSADIWGRYGMVLDAHDHPAAARAAYEMAVLLDPARLERLYYLEILLSDTLPERAEELLRRAIELDPNYAPARVRYGRLLDELGRADDALAQFEHARRLDPRNPPALVGVAQGLLNRGDLEAARRTLE